MEKGWKRRVPADKLEEAKEWAEGLSNFFLPQVAKFKAVGVANPEASEDPEQTDVEEEDEPIFSQKTPPRTSAKSAKAAVPSGPPRTRNPPPRMAKEKAKASQGTSDVEEVPPPAPQKVTKVHT